MKANKSGKRSWSITTHVIWPLICFALGLMVSAAMSKGCDDHSSGTEAARLVELMGRTNDLERTISDLERQLSESQHELESSHRELESTRQQLVEAKAKAGLAGSVEESPKEDWMKEVAEEAAWAEKVKAQGASGAKWSKVDKWQTTALEPMSFLQKFDIGYEALPM